MPTPSEIIKRSLNGHCPRCDSGKIFISRFNFAEKCPNCGLPLEKEDGWSLGAIPLNYTFTGLAWVLPICLIYGAGLIGLKTALVIAGAGAVIIPFLTYRLSKCLWLACYFFFLQND